jgi:hypothetical protein
VIPTVNHWISQEAAMAQSVKWSAFLKSYLSVAYEAVSHKRLAVDIKGTFVRLKLNNQQEESAKRF